MCVQLDMVEWIEAQAAAERERVKQIEEKQAAVNLLIGDPVVEGCFLFLDEEGEVTGMCDASDLAAEIEYETRFGGSVILRAARQSDITAAFGEEE
jgi:hypothetical protein